MATRKEDKDDRQHGVVERSLEQILAEIGTAGRFQYMFCTAVLLMEAVVGFCLTQPAVSHISPKWWCVDPTTLGTPNMTLDNTTFQRCAPSLPSSPLSLPNGDNATASPTAAANSNSTQRCKRYYDPDMVTVIGEWDLVCERKYVKPLINSVQMSGVLIGALLSGQISDTVGRRITFYAGMISLCVSTVAAGFSVNWQMYAVLRFLMGMAMGTYLAVHMLYMSEFVKHTWRPVLGCMPSWNLGVSMLCLAAWIRPNWRHLHFINVALTVPLLFAWFISPESLRWLAARGRLKQAEQVVNKIAKINGRNKMADVSEQLGLLREEEEEAREKREQQRYAYHLLFYGWRNAMKTVIVCFAWMSMSMSYYGIIFGVSALSGNLYLNLFLLSILVIPLGLATIFLVLHFGRRATACTLFILASLTGFAILVVDRTVNDASKGTIINVIAQSSILFIGAAWMCMQTYSVELFPTVIRSLGMAAANSAARVGGILAPFILTMETPDDAVQCYVIVGVMLGVSGLSILLLNETKGQTLTDTLHHHENHSKPTDQHLLKPIAPTMD